jgi:hypothetical protein
LVVIVLMGASIAGVEINQTYAPEHRAYFRIGFFVAQMHAYQPSRDAGKRTGAVHFRKSRPLPQDDRIHQALALVSNADHPFFRNRRQNVMRTSIIIAVTCGVLAATVLLGSEPAEAAGSRGSYCLEYNEGGADCSFVSFAQCNATADGEGAECYAITPRRAAMQEPGAYAFYHPNASLGIEAGEPPAVAMAAIPRRR